MTRKEFGRRFRDAREAAGLTQAAAAAAIGIPQPRIAEYEAGVRVPPTLRFLEFVSVLNLDPEIMFPEWFATP